MVMSRIKKAVSIIKKGEDVGILKKVFGACLKLFSRKFSEKDVKPSLMRAQIIGKGVKTVMTSLNARSKFSTL